VVGVPSSSETLVVDQATGTFTPGTEIESGASEIEIAVNLGDASDSVELVGTAGDDSIAVGQNGVALNADGDADITFSPLPSRIDIHGLGGVDTLSGRGGQGTGGLFAGRVVLFGGDAADTLRGGLGADELHGGSSSDLLEGREGADLLFGDAGDDTLAGGDQNDELTGGGGADSFAGSSGDDVFFAVDGESDVQLSGGPGTDTAHYDAVIDPVPVAVENRIPE
jgi:Ca2+-binding RTX toxin-like protein